MTIRAGSRTTNNPRPRCYVRRMPRWLVLLLLAACGSSSSSSGPGIAETSEHRADRRRVRAPSARRHDRRAVSRRRLDHDRARQAPASTARPWRPARSSSTADTAHADYTTGDMCPAGRAGVYKVVISKVGIHFTKVDDSCDGARRSTARPGFASSSSTDAENWRGMRRVRPRGWRSDVDVLPSVSPSGIQTLRAPRASRALADPALPAAAQLVAVQQPSATLPERPYDLSLLAAVLGLLGIGTVEIYSATAADALDALRRLRRTSSSASSATSRVGGARDVARRAARLSPAARRGPIRCSRSRSLLLGARARDARAQRRAALDPARPADVPAGRDRQARARHATSRARSAARPTA